MAELGALASLVGVVGAGLQLSVALYDFASTLGSAGREVEDIGYDITLLCAVLKRVQSTLDSPKSTRLSFTAIQTTQEIVNRCHRILGDISSILKKLRKDGQSDLDVLAKVRWTLKRPKILMLRGSLQSCTTTLHLMLSTIDWARNATRRSIIGEPSLDDNQDRQMTHSLFLAQQSSNHRLEELEDRAIEEATPTDEHPASPDRPSPPQTLSVAEDTFVRRKNNRSSAMIDAVVYPASVILPSSIEKRTSVLLNECLFEPDLSYKVVGKGPSRTFSHRQSIVYSEALMRRWTRDLDTTLEADLEEAHESAEEEPSAKPILQARSLLDEEAESEADSQLGDPLPRTLFTAPHTISEEVGNGNKTRYYSPRGSLALTRPELMASVGILTNDTGPGAPSDNVHRVGANFQPSMDDEIALQVGQLVRILRIYDDGWVLCSRLAGSQHGVAPQTCLSFNPVNPDSIDDSLHVHSKVTFPINVSTSIETQTTSDTKPPGDSSPALSSKKIFRSFRVGLDDPCYKVLPAALRKCNIQADWRTYVLYIVYGDQERAVGLHEKPLALLRDLDRSGKKPMFMLRKNTGFYQDVIGTFLEGGVM